MKPYVILNTHPFYSVFFIEEKLQLPILEIKKFRKVKF